MQPMCHKSCDEPERHYRAFNTHYVGGYFGNCSEVGSTIKFARTFIHHPPLSTPHPTTHHYPHPTAHQTAMLHALVEQGPISVGIAVPDSFNFYRSGIYVENRGPGFTGPDYPALQVAAAPMPAGTPYTHTLYTAPMPAGTPYTHTLYTAPMPAGTPYTHTLYTAPMPAGTMYFIHSYLIHTYTSYTKIPIHSYRIHSYNIHSYHTHQYTHTPIRPHTGTLAIPSATRHRSCYTHHTVLTILYSQCLQILIPHTLILHTPRYPYTHTAYTHTTYTNTPTYTGTLATQCLQILQVLTPHTPYPIHSYQCLQILPR
jgi:hypothetical protein